ncbi:hypothetical protein ACSC9U_15995 [Pseudomonas solani]|uniref:hypothetical protein n=1 Tax=Pseudomonas solani TaxID=2731552 RepID=UPI003F4AEAEE
MNQDPRKPDGLEQQMLAHFRAHEGGEPSAELDARILAAARAAVRPATPSLAERLHAWLFGPGGRQRWSVAFAGLACLGIGVSLTWRNLDRPDLDYGNSAPAPAAMMMPAPIVPAAPAAAPIARSSVAAGDTAVAGSMESAPEPTIQAYAAPAPAEAPQMAREAKKMAASRLAEEAERQAPLDALSDQAEVREQAVETMKAEASALAAKPRMAPGKAKEATLVEQLEALLQLREKGDTQAADALLARLREANPQLDIEAELARLGKRR